MKTHLVTLVPLLVACVSLPVQLLPARARAFAEDEPMRLSAADMQTDECRFAGSARVTAWAFVAPQVQLFDVQRDGAGCHREETY